MPLHTQSPRFWTCSIAKCSNPAVIDTGHCERCQSYFCNRHRESTQHTCKHEPLDDDAWEDGQTKELESLRGSVNNDQLLKLASGLRGGIECAFDSSDPLGRSRMGGMHVHLRIVFVDGTIWLARILRLNSTSFGDCLSNQILESECATLKWLETAGIPAPRLHHYGFRHDELNCVGVAYMLIDELLGKPLNQLQPSEGDKLKVYTDLAQILSTLSSHPFRQIGSLSFDSRGSIVIGPIAGDRTGTLSPIGPLSNATDYYSAWAEQYLSLISDHQLFINYPVNAYLIFRYLHKLAIDGKFNDIESSLDLGPFYLKHMDDKGDHVFVDEKYNITGIIDWSFARIVPAYEAFGPSLVTADMDDIFTGNVRASKDDKLLAEALRANGSHLTRFANSEDRVRRLTFALGMGMNLTWAEALCVFKGIVTESGCGVDDFEWETWRKDRLVEWADDERLLVLSREEAIMQQTCEKVPNASLVRKQVPRFATCSVEQCGRSSARGKSCTSCMRHLCTTHQARHFHLCLPTSELDDESWEKTITDEITTLLVKTNIQALCAAATSINHGKGCAFTPGQYLGSGAVMGCANYHAWLTFNDGEKWIVRIPRVPFSDIPSKLVEYLVTSEFATLGFLEKIKGIPTAKVFGYGLASDPDNLVGVSYIFMEAVPGAPYEAHTANPEQKRHVLSQVADILIEISKHPFRKAGSLILDDDGNLVVSEIASDRFVSLGQHGPYDTALDYYTNTAEQHLDIIADGQEYFQYPREAYLFFRTLRDQAGPKLVARETEEPSSFYLKHVDDKGDHLLVNEDYTITGIIEWQFARTVPACEAFGPSLITASLDKLYSKDSGLADDDIFLARQLEMKGRADLAKYMGVDELVRRFMFGLASGLYRSEILEVLSGLLKACGDECTDIEAWIAKQWEVCKDDARCDKIEALILENTKSGTID
ncbi:hypothetical protein LSUB1_G006555 [Lachnellula subtilissima]|uniref:Aminoglycoside phosphotransferase domain-containing protein n=1 Tax=Lachnellula subtilissima TaxID=602034 RepID=A0A8H8RF17_9HELO|nr:hypothetical protein LSUB1_G006555 [Lachnellula subtilissima]